MGLGIGFVANLIFAAVAMAGEMADLQTGLALAALVDPSSEERTAIIGQFQLLMAWLVFFLCNGHQVLLRGLAQSLVILPLGEAALPPGPPVGPLALISRTFVVALQIGAPVLGSVLVTDIALGLLARSVPQMNLLVIGLPIEDAARLRRAHARLAVPARGRAQPRAEMDRCHRRNSSAIWRGDRSVRTHATNQPHGGAKRPARKLRSPAARRWPAPSRCLPA